MMLNEQGTSLANVGLNVHVSAFPFEALLNENDGRTANDISLNLEANIESLTTEQTALFEAVVSG